MLFRVFRETRGYTTSNLITTEGLMTWSSEVFRKFLSHVVKWKSCKNRKLKESFVLYFGVWRKREKSVCTLFTTVLHFLQLYSFTYTTYKPSHHNHSIIPLSNHHTIIILKSHELRNMILLWWFESWMIRFPIGGMVWWEWWDVSMSVFYSKLLNF